ncbi:MAG TPA: hypothetical protein DEB06_06925 [Phycisphaerales bacterium]|nr:hypothetical protein [Phycisphaerales bacterium]
MLNLSVFRSVLTRAALSAVLAIPAAGATLLAAVPASAQGTTQASELQLIEDFIFYVNIANPELAKANAQALLDRGVDPKRFLALVEDSATLEDRFDRAYRRALMFTDLEDISARLYRLYEDGRLARARDPNEIARNIALLTGNPRGQILARERLAAAGEYAVPQLLDVLVQRRNPLLEAEVGRQLVRMGRQSVAPLAVALNGLDETTQEVVARILGELRYPASAPFLTELARTTGNSVVRESAQRALALIGGGTAAGGEGASVAGLFRDLAEDYYAEPAALTMFPGEEHQLLWDFDPTTGLQPSAVRTEVFHEAVAMRLSEHALTIDPTDQPTISLWIASNFSRELDQPEGYDNPAYPAGARREAMYYAVAAGAPATQRVLARALRDRDTKLARLAIEALSRSAGGAGLVGSEERALVRALSYPERRVRYEAAIALGRARPRESFDGAETVVPILASVIRDAATRSALVLASDIERQQVIRAALEGIGYTVLPPGFTLSDTLGSIAEVAGVDLMVTDLTTDTTIEAIDQARRTARLQATPILALMSAAGYAQHAARFEGDALTSLARQGVSDDQMIAGVEQLVARASGAPIDAEEARGYAMRSLEVLREIAVGSGSGGRGVFDVADASVPLMGALTEAKDEVVRARIAEVLSFIGQQRVQVALMDSVMTADGPERLARMAQMTDSAKRFGNLLEERQVRWLIERADSPDEDEATASAALMGALNLPNDRIVPLILGTR